MLLPGLAGAPTEFGAQAEHFGADRPVYALAPLTDGDLSIDGQADQFADLAAQQGIERCVVLGHSHGGLVALSLAVRRPDLVAGVILLDTPVMLPPPIRLLVRLPLAVLRTPLWTRALRAFFTATFTDKDTPGWRAEVMARLARVPRPVARAVVTGTFTYDSSAALRVLTVPVMCVRANIPVRLERLPAAVERGEILGVGHWPHVHAQDDTNALIDKFLVGLPDSTDEE
ncbi:alpha/beta hydrolase [Streptomyces sp. NPDC005500]|uniref:alpha/beta fold hydrolase n=1 Tax=Streptomyces sp. NPDC005500 TaxID=3155007 RepID=UPI0033A36760